MADRQHLYSIGHFCTLEEGTGIVAQGVSPGDMHKYIIRTPTGHRRKAKTFFQANGLEYKSLGLGRMPVTLGRLTEHISG